MSERLEQVYKGLGEMQTLASGVGDLKKVLSNVKTRGIFGEIQLGAIFGPGAVRDEYCHEKGFGKSSRIRDQAAWERREPVYRRSTRSSADAYTRVAPTTPATRRTCLREEDPGGVCEVLLRAISATNISTRPRRPTSASCSCPFEGLYAEVVSCGLVEVLQQDYKVSIAGPTTMAALLNSLQMGFRTLAIQKRSGEVWKVLGAVKTDLATAGGRRSDWSRPAPSLIIVGVRTRQIRSKLRTVTAMPEGETAALLGDAEE